MSQNSDSCTGRGSDDGHSLGPSAVELAIEQKPENIRGLEMLKSIIELGMTLTGRNQDNPVLLRAFEQSFRLLAAATGQATANAADAADAASSGAQKIDHEVRKGLKIISQIADPVKEDYLEGRKNADEVFKIFEALKELADTLKEMAYGTGSELGGNLTLWDLQLKTLRSREAAEKQAREAQERLDKDLALLASAISNHEASNTVDHSYRRNHNE
ncbi:hypothetical protein ONZ43_g5955 [Nemania bipapillata]|uniref:Uncharacterized protein n=1 Tax=Nemania bipapillata TaxID=110536 RepID=A0ACC2I4B2_9PEZI|nr:hypothetical protein ONZ43_g5955 [Nemania bipapillata]